VIQIDLETGISFHFAAFTVTRLIPGNGGEGENN
jgi:hypothetical protein